MVTSVLMVMIAAGIAWFVARDDGPNLVTGVETAATSGQESEAGSSQEAEDPSKGASPESEKQAEQQAKVLDALLTDSRGSRSGLGPALNQLRSCTDTAPALETVRRVTDARREQVVQVKALDTGAFDDGDGGDTVKNRLTEALTASFNADEAFLTWATRQDADCDKAWSGDKDYQRGLAFSGKATAAKRSFLELWNPLAQRYNLPKRAEHEI
ncbi:hypothetical protein SAMN05216276_102383 [Streptosporangium subroseum]|uniref:Uncharacterized protein n=1 Tax=Streptosporangium subroseum TaxID=106412 RepID=A0A239JME4_9ACTN|nr:hypothetical protein [Streptosporangium subroseum]SNT07196.1 hypothetical protein SAMN05216276_102383 [Streptosporangium subroseum]